MLRTSGPQLVFALRDDLLATALLALSAPPCPNRPAPSGRDSRPKPCARCFVICSTARPLHWNEPSLLCPPSSDCPSIHLACSPLNLSFFISCGAKSTSNDRLSLHVHGAWPHDSPSLCHSTESLGTSPFSHHVVCVTPVNSGTLAKASVIFCNGFGSLSICGRIFFGHELFLSVLCRCIRFFRGFSWEG